MYSYIIFYYCLLLNFCALEVQIDDIARKDLFDFHQQDIRVTALILARGGSKSIKLKNLANVGNLTLLRRSINAIVEADVFESFWVSTDHPLIAEEAVKGGAQVHNRSAESATDEASSIFAVQEFLYYHPEVEILALVQCTSPFIRPEYLITAFDLIKSRKPCAFSVNRSFKLRWKQTESGLIPLNFDPSKRPRRQDWDGELVENGMFYFAAVDLLRKGLFQNNEGICIDRKIFLLNRTGHGHASITTNRHSSFPTEMVDPLRKLPWMMASVIMVVLMSKH